MIEETNFAYSFCFMQIKTYQGSAPTATNTMTLIRHQTNIHNSRTEYINNLPIQHNLELKLFIFIKATL